MNEQRDAPDADLAGIARRLPARPGVYRFYDDRDDLLYVGKAASLRSRVRSYFSAATQSQPRVRLMISKAARLETTIVETASDALVLENEQIKSLRPRYNVMFRDDKSYPYLRLSDHAVPRLSFYRGKPKADCYGPYASTWSVRESIRVLQRIFRLRTCTDAMYANRSRPCLLHQIKLCSAPCVDKIGEDDYAADVAAARQFLAGDADGVAARLGEEMEQAAQDENYELAARHRDSIRALADIRHVNPLAQGPADCDLVGLHQEADGAAAVRLAAVRGGRLISELDFFPENAQASTRDDILAAFLAQHYGRHKAPARVVTRSALGAEVLARLIGAAKVTVIARPQGIERERLAMVETNAAAACAQRGASDDRETALTTLAELLDVAQLARIDCFDVSHSMGEEAVAACVVWRAGQMDKSSYRRYRLKRTPAGDDYAGMREALGRRYRKAAAEPAVLPDLIVIDGGAGQVTAALDAFGELGVQPPRLLGIAKGPERRPGMETLVTDAGEVLELPPVSAPFRVLQHIRDEAHRFAISGHRRRRDKQRRTSTLENIEGVGPARRRDLINAFGGLQGLRAASLKDLSRIRGVGDELARRIYLAVRQ